MNLLNHPKRVNLVFGIALLVFMTLYFISNVYSLTIKTAQLKKDLYSSRNASYVIYGTVIDSSLHQEIPGVSIALNHNSWCVVTDRSGHFELPLPDNLRTKKFRIIVSSIGYNTKKIKIDNRSQILTNSLTIYLERLKIDSNQIIKVCCN